MQETLYHSLIYRQDLEEVYQMVPAVERLQGKRVLITGSRGMIGSFLVDFFIYFNEEKNGSCEIYAAGRNLQALAARFQPYLKKEYFHMVPYDLEKEILWNFSPDYVIHGAGQADPAEFMKNAVKTLTISVTGTRGLLDYAKDHKTARFLYLSSGEVYGRGEASKGPWSETDQGYLDTTSPRSCYPVSKLAAENICMSFGRQTQMETVGARLCHTYGPTAVNTDQRVASAWLRGAAAGNRLVMKSDGSQRRSYCYAADCAAGILTILLRGTPYELYNVATDTTATIRELAEAIGRAAGIPVEYERARQEEENRFNPMKKSVLSAEKLTGLGWRGRYSLDRGIRHTLSILREESSIP